MYLIKKTVAFLCVYVLTTNCFAQNTVYLPQKISVAALKADFLLLRDTLQKIHPGIYRYKSSTIISHIFDSCYNSIQDNMTVPQFFMLINFAIAAMEDGHSNSRMAKQVMKDYINNTKLFPAMVMFIHNRAFIYCCNQNISLAGAELTSINNQPIQQIVQRSFAYIPSDADIQSRKNWELNENFPFFYPLLHEAVDKFNITYKNENGALKKATLQPDVFQNINCPAPFKRPEKYLQLTYKPGNIAVLGIKTFLDDFLQQTGENFNRFLDSAFTDIRNKNVTKLLIDIRGNQGGNDGNGALLYAYLTQQPFMYYASQETVSGKFAPDDNHPNLKWQQPKQNSFAGKVYILADGHSFSASAEFSAIARSNKRALFLGEEAGGGYYGNTSGNELFITLPNSQLSCRIPLVKYTSAVKKNANKGNSILPEYPIYQTIFDFINHTDSQLDRALVIVGQNQKQ
ncbi:MAG: S41 family peptidase [Niastella sp.]|uniref:S41 family peptidase n=1 Tax=Niastella sp. TaxID=1869183 RepID=UPI00389AB6CF